MKVHADFKAILLEHVVTEAQIDVYHLINTYKKTMMELRLRHPRPLETQDP